MFYSEIRILQRITEIINDLEACKCLEGDKAKEAINLVQNQVKDLDKKLKLVEALLSGDMAIICNITEMFKDASDYNACKALGLVLKMAANNMSLRVISSEAKHEMIK